MNAIPLTATRPSAPTFHSLVAYVVPHFIEITAAGPGTVASVLVERRQVVRRGQTLAMVEPLGLHAVGERRGVPLKAPAAGLVTRRWASPGDDVGGGSPVLSLASAENVLVVAKFPAGVSLRFARGGTALVRIAGRELLARILTVVDAAPEWPAAGDAPETRVVASLPHAPAELLWPGTPVAMELRP